MKASCFLKWTARFSFLPSLYAVKIKKVSPVSTGISMGLNRSVTDTSSDESALSVGLFQGKTFMVPIAIL
jgi:hypothetical protein